MTVRQQLAVQNDCYRRNQGGMGKNPGTAAMPDTIKAPEG